MRITLSDLAGVEEGVKTLDLQWTNCTPPPRWPVFGKLEELSITCRDSNTPLPASLSLTSMPELKRLIICLVQDDSTMQPLCPIIQLGEEKKICILVKGCRLNEEIIKSIINCLGEELCLQQNNLDEQTKEILMTKLGGGRFPDLTVLEIVGNSICDPDLGQFNSRLSSESFPKLKKINLEGNCIRFTGVANLVKGLKYCLDLVDLNLGWNQIRNIPTELTKMAQLKAVDFSYNGIKRVPEDLIGLFQSLRKCELEGNPLECPPKNVYDLGPGPFKRYLKNMNRNVQELDTVKVILLADSRQATIFSSSIGRDTPQCSDREGTGPVCITKSIIDGDDALPVCFKVFDLAGWMQGRQLQNIFISSLCIFVIAVEIPRNDQEMENVADSSIKRMISVLKYESAQIVVVGTAPDDEYERNRKELLDRLETLKQRLINADDRRLEAWGDAIGPHTLHIRGVFLASYRKGAMTEQTLAPIKGKLREIAQHAVEEKQRLSPGYTLTLEAHKKLAKTTPTGVSSLQAFRDQAPGVEDQDLIKGLQLASDVGILQYYRQIEPEIVLTDPLFLMEALGVLLYDKETFKTYFTEKYRKKYVDHAAVNQAWTHDLYRQGIIARRNIYDLWQFQRDDGDKSAASRSKLAETIINVLIHLEIVLQHPRNHDGVSPDASKTYYFVPEIWARRLAEENRMDAQAWPTAYDSRIHMMIGRKMEIKGHVLPIFLQKMWWRCAMEVSSADKRVSWTQGKITIDHDGGFKWRAATWPKKEYALALSLENTGQGALILKIASLNGANDFLRQINVKVAEVLKNVALEEHISIKSRVGILPSGGDVAADDLVWVDEEDVEDCIRRKQRVLHHCYNGTQILMPLCIFNREDGVCCFLPNFDDMRMIARQDCDPDFILLEKPEQKPQDSTTFFIRAFKAMKMVVQIVTSISGQEIIKKAIVRLSGSDRPEMKKLARQVNVADCGFQGGDLKTDYNLFMTLPFRNLYVPVESFHDKVIQDFTDEVLLMMEKLGGKTARVTINTSTTRKATSNKGFKVAKIDCGAPSEAGCTLDESLPKVRSWDPPSFKGGGSFPVDEEMWYYLNEKNAHCCTNFYGLDLKKARESVLNMKRDRINGGKEVWCDVLR